jgi:hypothetical protein
MSLRISHETLTSLAVSAMLTSAFLAPAPNGISAAAAGPQPQIIMNALSGLRASGWAGTQEIIDPAAVGAPQSAASASADSTPKSILTAEQQKKLTTLMASFGHDVTLMQIITHALGLTKGSETLTPRQLSVNGHPDIHTYIPLSDGGFLIMLAGIDTAWSYRLDAGFTLIAAVSKNTGQAPTVFPIPDAERNVQTEIIYWAGVADRH